MSYNDYMYAVDRSDEYLAHYGIKGMKWGVQKAIASGNSNKLARQYKKAQKKLAKLEKRANNGSKYARRAAALGAGAALAGGAAALGTSGLASAMDATRRIGGGAMRGAGSLLSRTGIKGASKLGRDMKHLGRKMQQNGGSSAASEALDAWGKSNNVARGAIAKGVGVANSNLGTLGTGAVSAQGAKRLRLAEGAKAMQNAPTNNTIARIGAGALGAGLAGAAAYNAYRAATTKKAAAKAQQFRSEMNKAFAGTKYANGGNGSSGGSKKRRRR